MGRRSQSTASKYSEMSKSRKAKRKAAAQPPVMPSFTPPASQSVVAVAAPAVAPKAPSVTARYARKGQPASEALTTDYSYIAKDLRQIAMTALAMFAIIAILYFVLR